MNTRLIAFSLTTAVGVCLAALQLTANEPSTEGRVLCGDAGCSKEVTEAQRAELADGLAVTEECQFCKEAGCFDTAIDETVANQRESEDGREVDAYVCIDEACESEPTAVAEGAGTIDFEVVEADVADFVQTSEEAVEETAAGPAEEADFSTDEDVVDEFECVEGFEGWVFEREVKAEELIHSEALLSEAAEVLADEVNVETAQPANENVIMDLADDTEVTATSEPELSEDVDVEILVVEPENIGEETDIDTKVLEHPDTVEVENNAGVPETTTDADAVTQVATVSNLPDQIAAEQAVKKDFDDTGSEPSEGETTQELIEELTELIDEDSPPDTDAISDADDAVIDNGLPVEIGHSPELPESKRAAIEEGLEAGTVRTIELGDCKVIIESERQIDDYELLEMLWQAVNQFEFEMD